MGVSLSSGGSLSTGKTLWVDSVNGNDVAGTRGFANKPYLTLLAAQTAAQTGDLIHVRPGTYTDKNLGLNGVNWHFEQGADITISAALTSNDIIFGDHGGQSCTYSITGYGKFSITSTGTDVPFAVFRTISTTSNIYIECLSMTAAVGSGSNGYGCWCSGGSQSIRVDSITARSDVFRVDTSPTTAQFIWANNATTIAGSVMTMQSGTGTQDAYINLATGGGGTQCVKGNGTRQTFHINAAVIGVNGNGLVGGDGYQKGYCGTITVGSGTYGIDGASSSGIQVIEVGQIISGDRGVTARGTGTNYWKVGTCTAPNAIVINNGTSTIEGGEFIGNSATAACQILNSGNSAKVTIKNARIVNSHATGPVMNVADTTAINILDGACYLIGQSGSTFCITGTAATTVKLYGTTYANKTPDLALVYQIGAINVDSNVV